jgi:hypothetical protein
MSPSCPSCSGKSVIEGRLSISGTDEGSVTRFYPKGLRFFTMRKSVALSNGQMFRACLTCGHIWSQAGPSELRELLSVSGDQTTLDVLKHSQTDAGQASKLKF